MMSPNGCNITGWPPSQGSQGSQGKVREFICCLKKVKNGQGIKQKDAAKSGKKDEIGKMKKRSGNLHTVPPRLFWNVCTSFILCAIYSCTSKFLCLWQHFTVSHILLDWIIMKTIFVLFLEKQSM